MRIIKITWMSLCLVFVAVQANADSNSDRIKLTSAPLALKMTCESAASADPLVSLTLTNVGSSKTVIPNEAVYTTVDLTVKDQGGSAISPKSGRDGGDFSLGDRILQPGQSLELNTYIDASTPPISRYPISKWGYRGLPSGTYSITAAAAKPAEAASVSRCVVNVR